MERHDEVTRKSGYAKHSKLFWVGVYVVIAIVAYGAIYLFLVHPNGGAARYYTNSYVKKM